MDGNPASVVIGAGCPAARRRRPPVADQGGRARMIRSGSLSIGDGMIEADPGLNAIRWIAYEPQIKLTPLRQ